VAEIEIAVDVDAPTTAAAANGVGRVRAAVAGSMAGKAAELVTLVLLATVVPRWLGPDVYGRFSVPLTIVTLGSLALSLGGPTVMARFVPAAPAGQRVAVARAIGARLARGRALQLVGVAAVAGLAAVVAPDRFPPATTTLVVVSLVLSVGATLALQVPLGLGRTGPWSLRYPLQNAVLIVAVLLLHGRWDDLGSVVAILVSTVVAAGYAAVVLRPLVAQPADAVALPDGALRFGTFHAVGAALVQVAQRGGVVAVAVLGGSSSESGHAALAIGLALGVTYAVLQSFTVALPLVAAVEAGTPAEAEATLSRLAALLLAVIVPAAVVASWLADRWVPGVFGTDYEPATDAFGPALAMVVLAPLTSLAVQLAALRIRPAVTAALGVAAAATFMVTAVAAVPSWEAVGATTAAFAGTLASATTALVLLRGAFDRRLVLASFTGAAAVLLAGLA
jgi:O-antigen/teichoic acid export membrane protein